jgi:hypothetical protein
VRNIWATLPVENQKTQLRARPLGRYKGTAYAISSTSAPPPSQTTTHPSRITQHPKTHQGWTRPSSLMQKKKLTIPSRCLRPTTRTSPRTSPPPRRPVQFAVSFPNARSDIRASVERVSPRNTSLQKLQPLTYFYLPALRCHRRFPHQRPVDPTPALRRIPPRHGHPRAREGHQARPEYRGCSYYSTPNHYLALLTSYPRIQHTDAIIAGFT